MSQHGQGARVLFAHLISFFVTIFRVTLNLGCIGVLVLIVAAVACGAFYVVYKVGSLALGG